MPAFFEYLRNITYYLMFATVAGIFAPAGKYKKFVSLVLGFILLLMMIRPLAGLGEEIPVTQWFTGIIPSVESTNWDTSYTDWRDMYLRGVFESQLEAQLKTLLSGEGFTVHSAEFSYSDDFSRITEIWVSLSRADNSSQRVPIIQIRPPSFGNEEEPCAISTDAKNLISQFYNLPVAHIHVLVND